MKNETEPSDVKTVGGSSFTKRAREISSPPKPPKVNKAKLAYNLIRKPKLKLKSVPTRTESLKLTSTTTKTSSLRQFNKSASETNLQESLKLSEDIGAEITAEPYLGVENRKKIVQQETKNSLPELTRSLHNLRTMPAYGELILDSSNQESITNSTKPKDHLYKILVIGDLGTGKTSIIKRYVHRFFTQHYRATIGVDFALKVLNWDENTLIRLQLWDIAGQERYGNMTRVYYKEAVGAFIVFDVTRRNTFESVANWKQDLDSKVQLPDGSHIPCVLLANKCDQQKEGLVTNAAKMDEYCEENGFAAWFETSARDNINIDEGAKALVEKILEKDAVISNDKRGDQFSITAESNLERSGTKCAC